MPAQAGSDYARRALACDLVLIRRSVPGDVSVGIKCDARVLSDDEEDVDFDIIHNANDTFTVKYVPPAPGRYTIKVLFASEVCWGLILNLSWRMFYEDLKIIIAVNVR